MTETEGLLKVRDVVARALCPDSGATLESLMGEILDVLVDFDLDPIAAFEIIDEYPPAPRDNVVPLRPWLH
jgi:hypothetical protein